ncbi:MAG: hypothetical protein HXX11_15770 [Desulfuromonadales bacterium]|nr:hypothetical protein [Desulfuromonadales bacterium]
MHGKLLFLINRYGEWTYARLDAVEAQDEYITITFIPRSNDDALKNILSEYRGFVGLACESHTCHASIREIIFQQAHDEELVKIHCRRIELKSTLALIAEEKVEQWEQEWDKPSRALGTYDGMMGFAQSLPVRPGFVILVNQVAWRILLGRDMPYEYGQKGRVSMFSNANGTADPKIRALLDTPCPFRLLYPVLGHQMDEFLELSRLFAGYLLMDHGVVDYVRTFSAEADPDGQLRVSFKGSRAGVMRDDLPIQVVIQDAFLLDPPTDI